LSNRKSFNDLYSINMALKEKAVKVWKSIRPWVTMLALVLVLRYTGALSAISYVTGRVLLKTGAMDAAPEEPAVAKNFNYNFKVTDLNGTVTDFKDLKGKTIFLNLWATWCGPCRYEMPSIQKLYNKVDKDKIVFVMLSLDHDKNSKEKVESFVKEKEYTFPVYLPKGYLPEQLQVRVIPTTFVISPEGKIVSEETGAANYDTDDFREFLEKISIDSRQ
jgi:thiol-disulfide isomerase/thioredoxin